jgi:DNA-binding response OmpR family regulator
MGSKALIGLCHVDRKMNEKILLVNDDLDILRLVGLMLERQGFLIHGTNSADQVMEIAISERPDLIVLDDELHGISAHELIKQLRTDKSTAEIPIILWIVSSHSYEVIIGSQYQADAYLTKPIQPGEFQTQIQVVLAQS